VGLELHYGYARWGAAVLRPVFAHLDGRFAESRQMAEKALALRGDALNSILYLYIQRTFALREEGEIGSLERQLEMLSKRMKVETLGGAPSIVVQTAWALLRCEVGDVAGARRDLNRLIDEGFPGPLDDPAWITGVAFVAEVCAYLGDNRLVPRLYELLQLRAGECIVVALAVACLGSVDRYLGILAAMQGLWDASSEHFEAALEMNRDRMRAQVWTAHTEADYAGALARRGRPSDIGPARALCESAAATARRLGMPRVQAQAAAILTSLG
jgi:tetratricopeptide (TPR) repeat protein